MTKKVKRGVVGRAPQAVVPDKSEIFMSIESLEHPDMAGSLDLFRGTRIISAQTLAQESGMPVEEVLKSQLRMVGKGYVSIKWYRDPEGKSEISQSEIELLAQQVPDPVSAQDLAKQILLLLNGHKISFERCVTVEDYKKHLSIFLNDIEECARAVMK